MSDLDYYKLKEISNFKNELIRTGTISQSKVKAFEERVGSNIITSNHKLSLFTGLESAYGHKEAISILESLLLEPSNESILVNRSTSAIEENVAKYVSEFLRCLRKPEFMPSSVSDMIYNSLDTVVLDKDNVQNDKRLGDCSIREFLSVTFSRTIRDEDILKIFKLNTRTVEDHDKIVLERFKSLKESFIQSEYNNIGRSLMVDIYLLILSYIEKDKIASIKGFSTKPISMTLDTLDLIYKNYEFITRIVKHLVSETILKSLMCGEINYFETFSGSINASSLRHIVTPLSQLAEEVNILVDILKDKVEIKDGIEFSIMSDFYKLLYEAGINKDLYNLFGSNEAGLSDEDGYLRIPNIDHQFLFYL